MNTRMTMQRPYPYHQSFVPQQMQRPQRVPVGGIQQSLLGQYQTQEPFIPPQSFPYNPQMGNIPFPYVGAEQIIGPNAQPGFSMMFNPDMTYLMCIPMHFDGRSQMWNCQNGIIVSPHMATNIAGYNVTYHTVQSQSVQHNGYGPAVPHAHQQPGSPNGSGNSYSNSSNENLTHVDGSPQHGVNSTPQPTCGVAPYSGQPMHGPGYNQQQNVSAMGGVGGQPHQQIVQPQAQPGSRPAIHQNRIEEHVREGSPAKYPGSNMVEDKQGQREQLLDGHGSGQSLANSFDSGEAESTGHEDHSGQTLDGSGVPRSDSINSDNGSSSDVPLDGEVGSMRRESSGALIVESHREPKSQHTDQSSVRSSPLNATDMRSGESPISMVARENSRTSTPLTKQFNASNGPRGAPSPSPVTQVPDGRHSSQSLTGFNQGALGNEAGRGSRPPSSTLPLANGTAPSPVNMGAGSTPAAGSEPQGKMSWARIVGGSENNRPSGGTTNQPSPAASSSFVGQSAQWSSKQSVVINATPKPAQTPPTRPPQPQGPWSPNAATYPPRRPDTQIPRQFEYPRLKREEAEAYPDDQQVYIPPFPREITSNMLAQYMKKHFGEDLVDIRQRLMGSDKMAPRMCYVLFKSTEPVQSLLRQRTIKIGDHELAVQAKPRESPRAYGNGTGGYRR